MLYQFKGCFDIELRDVFFNLYYREFSLRYKGYTVVPIPSHELDDIKREFNHVIEMYRCLNLPIEKVLYKSERYKQSDHKSSERNQIGKILKMSSLEKIRNKKILLVDDVYTTGSTLRAAIKLVEQAKPKQIEILVMAKTIFKPSVIGKNAKSIGDK